MMTEEFLDYLTRELSYSPHTVAAYRTDLSLWADYATGGDPSRLSPMDVTASDLRTWVASLSRSGLSQSSIRRKVQALRAFFKYLMRYHGLQSNPAAQLTLARLPGRLPVYVRPEETRRMLDEAENSEAMQEFATARDALVLELLYDTGMRCSELTGLLDCNVNTRDCELKVHGKRNKDRIIPIGTTLARMIDSYRDLRESSPVTAQGRESKAAPLLVGARGGALNRRQVYRIVHDAMAGSGIHATRLSPHVMRHSFATDMLNSGADLNSVRQLLGHASLASTQIYTHITNRELQLNYQHAHPRALKKGGQNGNYD